MAAPAASVGDPGSVGQGPPSRRRLLALIGSLPFHDARLAPDRPPHPHSGRTGPSADPMPLLFAEFQSLLDRHATALAACDQIEAKLQIRVGLPRVALPRGPDGGRRYVADVQSFARAMPPCRRRHRLEGLLRHRQRRWDAAAAGSGLLEAELHAASFDKAVLEAADTLLAMPTWTYEAITLKLVVILSVRAPETSDLSATNRIVGRVPPSAMASASRASFFCALKSGARIPAASVGSCALLDKGAAHVVRIAACLHRHDASKQLRAEGEHSLAPPPSAIGNE